MQGKKDLNSKHKFKPSPVLLLRKLFFYKSEITQRIISKASDKDVIKS